MKITSSNILLHDWLSKWYLANKWNRKSLLAADRSRRTDIEIGIFHGMQEEDTATAYNRRKQQPINNPHKGHGDKTPKPRKLKRTMVAPLPFET